MAWPQLNTRILVQGHIAVLPGGKTGVKVIHGCRCINKKRRAYRGEGLQACLGHSGGVDVRTCPQQGAWLARHTFAFDAWKCLESRNLVEPCSPCCTPWVGTFDRTLHRCTLLEGPWCTWGARTRTPLEHLTPCRVRGSNWPSFEVVVAQSAWSRVNHCVHVLTPGCTLARHHVHRCTHQTAPSVPRACACHQMGLVSAWLASPPPSCLRWCVSGLTPCPQRPGKLQAIRDTVHPLKATTLNPQTRKARAQHTPRPQTSQIQSHGNAAFPCPP